MPWLAAVAQVGGSLLGSYMGGEASKAQTEASQEALQMQLAAAEQERARQMAAAERANSMLGQASQQGQDQLRASMAAGQSALTQGFEQGRADLGQYYGQGRADLMRGDQLAMGRMAAGVQGARQDLMGGQAGIESAYRSGLGSAQGTLQQTAGNSRLAALMGGGLQSGFQADPGYQFRKQQGEQALARQAAASGGRLGGAALKSLMNFNSGLASQEYGNYANRAIGMAQSEDARQAGLMGQLAGMQYGTGGQIAGARGNLAQGLAQGQMQYGLQGGQYGQQLGQGLGGAAFGQGSALANLATGQGGALSNLQMQGGQNLAQMMYGTGQQMGANVLTGAGASAALTNNMLGQYTNPVGYAGGQQAAWGQGIASASQGLATALSAYGQMADSGYDDYSNRPPSQSTDWGTSGSNY